MSSLPYEILNQIISDLSDTDILQLPLSVIEKALRPRDAAERYSASIVALNPPGLITLHRLIITPVLAFVVRDLTILTCNVAACSFNNWKDKLNASQHTRYVTRSVYSAFHDEDASRSWSTSHSRWSAQQEAQSSSSNTLMLVYAFQRLENLRSITVIGDGYICIARVNIMFLRAMQIAERRIRRISTLWRIETEWDIDEDAYWKHITELLRAEEDWLTRLEARCAESMRRYWR